MTNFYPIQIESMSNSEQMTVEEYELKLDDADANLTVLVVHHSIFENITSEQIYPSNTETWDTLHFYSVWNQCIAQLAVRVEANVLYCHDFHGALAPWYCFHNQFKENPTVVSVPTIFFQKIKTWRTSQRTMKTASQKTLLVSPSPKRTFFVTCF